MFITSEAARKLLGWEISRAKNYLQYMSLAGGSALLTLQANEELYICTVLTDNKGYRILHRCFFKRRGLLGAAGLSALSAFLIFLIQTSIRKP